LLNAFEEFLVPRDVAIEIRARPLRNQGTPYEECMS
jgi:hypothetical protein